MKYQNSYIIAFRELPNGNYDYDFDIGNEFFESLDYFEIKKGSIQLHIDLHKSTSFLLLTFQMKGSVFIQCDRCLDDFETPVDLEATLRVVFEEGINETESDVDIMYVSPKEDEFDIRHYIYESILLNLPTQRVHPNNEKGRSQCNKEMLKLLKQHSKSKDKNETDPRWDALKKFNNLN